jgi:hypothetical protein
LQHHFAVITHLQEGKHLKKYPHIWTKGEDKRPAAVKPLQGSLYEANDKERDK